MLDEGGTKRNVRKFFGELFIACKFIWPFLQQTTVMVCQSGQDYILRASRGGILERPYPFWLQLLVYIQ